MIALIAVIAIAAIAVAAFALSSGNDKHEGNSDEPDKPVDDYYPVTVSTVMNGGTALQTVTKKPERILVWESATVELLCYFGLGDRVVGEYTVAEPKRTCILPELQSAYDAVPKLDKSTFSIEQAVSLRPDAILGFESTFTDSYLGSCESWNARGTSCFVTNRPANCVDDYMGILEMIGKIFNMFKDQVQLLIQLILKYMIMLVI